MRVLLLEENELLGDAIKTGLKHYHYTVDWVKNGTATIQALLHEHFGIVILDLGSSKSAPENLLKTIRTKNSRIPIIVIANRESVNDCVHCLDLGADDYLPKPFDLEELCARMRAIQRRSVSRAEPKITLGNIVFDPAARSVFKDKQSIELSRREFALLQVLLENAGRVLSREQLAQSLYGWGDDIDSNALEVHIHNLRKKFGEETIRTVRGIGYMFVTPAKETIKN